MGEFLGTLSSAASGAGNAIGSGLQNAGQGLWSGLKSAGNVIGEGVTGTAHMIGHAANSAYEGLGDLFTSAYAPSGGANTAASTTQGMTGAYAPKVNLDGSLRLTPNKAPQLAGYGDDLSWKNIAMNALNEQQKRQENEKLNRKLNAALALIQMGNNSMGRRM